MTTNTNKHGTFDIASVTFSDNIQLNKALARIALQKLNATYKEVIRDEYIYSKEDIVLYTLIAREEADKFDLHKDVRKHYINNRVKELKSKDRDEKLNAYCDGVNRYFFNMSYHVYDDFNTTEKRHALAELFRKCPIDTKKEIAIEAQTIFYEMVSNEEFMKKLLESMQLDCIPFPIMVSCAVRRAFNVVLLKRVRNYRTDEKAKTENTNNLENLYSLCTSTAETIETTETLIAIRNILEDREYFLILGTIKGYKVSEMLEEYIARFGDENYRSIYRRLDRAKKTLKDAFNC